jgi:hypothetical protein
MKERLWPRETSIAMYGKYGVNKQLKVGYKECCGTASNDHVQLESDQPS